MVSAGCRIEASLLRPFFFLGEFFGHLFRNNCSDLLFLLVGFAADASDTVCCIFGNTVRSVVCAVYLLQVLTVDALDCVVEGFVCCDRGFKIEMLLGNMLTHYRSIRKG